MTEPFVTPSSTSPCNVPGAGGRPWRWWPPSCDGGWQWKILAFHPGKKGSKQTWFCPQAINWCGQRRNISILTGFMLLRFEWKVGKGVIYLPVKCFFPGYKLLKNGWVAVLLLLVMRKIENSTLLIRVVVWKTENITLLRSTPFKRVISEKIEKSTLLKRVVGFLVW